MTEKYFCHLDGGLYRFVAHARSADADGEVVVYEHLWPFDQSLWVRNRPDFEARFTTVDESTVERAMKENRAQAQERVNAARTHRREIQKSSEAPPPT